MEKFIEVTGIAAPLSLINIDTDMIIPKKYLTTLTRTGLGGGLFSELRYDDEGRERPDFILNKPAYRRAKILVTGKNFGSGSSREHAPWALLDFGIKVVIAPSFSDIFYNNCFQNGILPVILPQLQVDRIMTYANRGGNATLTVNLPKQQITGADFEPTSFEIEPFLKKRLIEGLDQIAITLKFLSKITLFEDKIAKSLPWV